MRKGYVSIIGLLTITVCLSPMIANGSMTPHRIPDHSEMFPQIEYYRVRVVINGRFAHTEVDQAFKNPNKTPLNGTYFLPVPEGSDLGNLTVTVDGTVKTPQVVKDDEANMFLKSQVIEQNDSSFLKYLDEDIFLFNVSLVPNQTRKIHLEYDEFLTKDNNAVKYSYPLSTATYSVSQVPYINLSVDIHSDKGVRNVYVPEYDTNITRNSRNDVLVTWERGTPLDRVQTRGPQTQKQQRQQRQQSDQQGSQQGQQGGQQGQQGGQQGQQGGQQGQGHQNIFDKYIMPGVKDGYLQPSVHYKDLTLFYTPVEDGYAGSLLNYDDGTDRFFMFLYSREAEDMEFEPLPKDVIFVFDKSGSMNGEKIGKTREALMQMIGLLTPRDRYDLVTFDSEVYTLFGELAPATCDNVETGLQTVGSLSAGGSTAINDALMTGFDEMSLGYKEGRTRMILFLTDGLANEGESSVGGITANVENANSGINVPMFIFGVGTNVNNHLLGQLAQENYGEVYYIDQSGVDLDQVVLRVFNENANPVLSDVTVEFNNITTDLLYPENIGNLYRGSEILLVGKYTDTADAGECGVFVNGTGPNGTVSDRFRFGLGPNTDHPHIAHLWATRRIGDLLFNISITGGGTPEQIEEVIELSMKYGIVTPYTYLVIEENSNEITQDNEKYNADSDNDGVVDGNEDQGQQGQQGQGKGQGYKKTTSSTTATGANVRTVGTRAFVELFGILFDLELFLENNITRLSFYNNDTVEDWIQTNLTTDREVTFGSEEYFHLVPENAKTLALGNLIVFNTGNEVVYVTNASDTFFLLDESVDIDGSEVIVSYLFNKPTAMRLYYSDGSASGWKEIRSPEEKRWHIFHLMDLEGGTYSYYAVADRGDTEIFIDLLEDPDGWQVKSGIAVYSVNIGPVMDQHGKPITGLTVNITGKIDVRKPLDETGSLTVELPSGRYTAKLEEETGKLLAEWVFTVSVSGELMGDVPIVETDGEPAEEPEKTALENASEETQQHQQGEGYEYPIEDPPEKTIDERGVEHNESPSESLTDSRKVPSSTMMMIAVFMVMVISLVFIMLLVRKRRGKIRGRGPPGAGRVSPPNYGGKTNADEYGRKKG